MSALKKKKLVMLSQEKASTLYLDLHSQCLYLNVNGVSVKKSSGIIPQNLYVLSEEKLQEGDYAISHIADLIYKVKDPKASNSVNDHKVISTTDPDIDLPRPSQEFLLKYLLSYNTKEPIEYILVQYTYDSHKLMVGHVMKENHRPKVDKKGFITIKPIKNNYTRREVELLLNKLVKSDFIDFSGFETALTGWRKFDKFLNENL